MTKLGFIVLPSAADALPVQAADTIAPLREIGSAIQHLDRPGGDAWWYDLRREPA